MAAVYCIFEVPADEGEETFQVFRQTGSKQWDYVMGYSELKKLYATLGRTDVPDNENRNIS